MQINDVKRNVENLWSEASASWQDDMSKKYKIAVIDQMEIIDIRFRELTIPLFVLVGFNHIEFFFPESDQGSVDTEHIGYFSDRIIQF